MNSSEYVDPSGPFEARYRAFLETIVNIHEALSTMYCSPRATVIHGMRTAIRYTDVPCAWCMGTGKVEERRKGAQR